MHWKHTLESIHCQRERKCIFQSSSQYHKKEAHTAHRTMRTKSEQMVQRQSMQYAYQVLGKYQRLKELYLIPAELTGSLASEFQVTSRKPRWPWKNQIMMPFLQVKKSYKDRVLRKYKVKACALRKSVFLFLIWTSKLPTLYIIKATEHRDRIRES